MQVGTATLHPTEASGQVINQQTDWSSLSRVPNREQDVCSSKPDVAALLGVVPHAMGHGTGLVNSPTWARTDSA